MLSFDIRSLADRAAQVDGDLPASDPVWAEGDVLPTDAVHATGRISSAGGDRFYWSGRIEGHAEAQCRRCLTSVIVPVSEEVHLLFTDRQDDEADEADVFRIPPRANDLDLRPAVREQWLLASPTFALCREDCKGLCPHCGADLNAGACTCPPETDDRWAALRNVPESDARQ
jgi:uncharacterized protein